jgi:acetoin utilization deacetylase AcuC-like enzyme
MSEIAWDIERIEAQAKKWQEMASVLTDDRDRVAWLIEQIAYLSASHMQLQQVCRVHSDAVVNVLNKAEGIEQVQLIQMQSIAERLEALERKS